MESIEKIHNIQKISLLFFIATGILHFGAAILIANHTALKTAAIMSKTMDIPFFMTGIIYGLTSLRIRLHRPSTRQKNLDITIISVIIITLIILLAINLLIPDLQ